ncbi:MAG: hypothetical protein IKA37_00825 [Spirochaetales bacterium]|nr:hypothetical protein [Spirochaetales bacterium]
MNIIEKKLFETQAMKVANPERPFWYTSGKLGPYFINTHFLYGNETFACELLEKITNLVDKPADLIKAISEDVWKFYQTNELYREVMDEFAAMLNANETFKSCDVITGGERRDWFFSIAAARLTGKKHYFIFKDLAIYDENGVKIESLNGMKIAHIADLITEASSYDRAWIPAIEAAGAKMIFTASIVDRNQGGRKLLESKNVEMFAPVSIAHEFFNCAKEEGILSEEQFKMVYDFTEDPDAYGIAFLKSHPNYIQDSIENGDKSTKSKAQRCLDTDPYHLK